MVLQTASQFVRFGQTSLTGDAVSLALVRELGFVCAVSTAWGAARAGCDIYQIPRFTPWDRTDLRFGLRLIGNRWRRDYEMA